MTLTFGTNRFGFPDPARLIQSCREAEAAGFDHLWFPDSQLRMGDMFVNVLTAAQHTEHARVGTPVGQPGHASSERDGGGHSYPLSIGVHGYG